MAGGVAIVPARLRLRTGSVGRIVAQRWARTRVTTIVQTGTAAFVRCKEAQTGLTQREQQRAEPKAKVELATSRKGLRCPVRLAPPHLTSPRHATPHRTHALLRFAHSLVRTSADLGLVGSPSNRSGRTHSTNGRHWRVKHIFAACCTWSRKLAA